ncbi:MAG: penicillin-binding protein 2 [bacterium]|nr:penicillin-binding protein 2 [bacterium]
MRPYQKRIIVVWGITVFAFLVIVTRLFDIQVIKRAEFVKKANKIQKRDRTYVLPRGTIFDRDNNILAMSNETWSIYSHVKMQGRDRSKIAGLCKLSEKKIGFIVRRISMDTASQIEKEKIPNISFVSEYKRFYPLGEPLGSLLGFVKFEDDATKIQGLCGIEGGWNKYLAGKGQKIVIEKDGVGSVTYTKERFPDELCGYNLSLSISESLQYFAYKKLKETCLKYKANGGVVMVMAVGTGEILASCSWPSFDPNIYSDWNPSEWKRIERDNLRNRAISWVIEPGSLLKPIICAILLQEGVVGESDKFFCLGSMEVGGRKIFCVHKHGDQTFRDVLVNSCNVGMTCAIQRLDGAILVDYLKRFGFGDKAGIGLDEEENGILPRNKPSELGKSNLSFGYGIGVTPLQMLMAISTIANQGLLVQPILVSRILEGNDCIIKEYYPSVKRRVISEAIAKQVSEMMIDVVEKGTGKAAKIAGYKICGKTGTAEKATAGGYDKDKVVASFVGWLPAENPKVAILVMIDEPQAGVRYGGVIAAPVFRDIAEKIIVLYGIKSESGETNHD